MEKILMQYAGKKSILGICLGLQAIVLFFGGRLKQLDEVVHGRKKIITKITDYSKSGPHTYRASKALKVFERRIHWDHSNLF